MVFNSLNLFSQADPNQHRVNNVDSDETAPNEASHQDLHCLPFCLFYYYYYYYLYFLSFFICLFWTEIAFCINGQGQTQEWENPLGKRRYEMLKSDCLLCTQVRS